MSLEVLDLLDFVSSGGLFAIILIAGILFALQAILSFLIWRRGEEKYKLQFISYLFAAIAVALGAGLISSQYIGLAGSTALRLTGLGILTFAGIAAVAIRIFIFIRAQWLSKGEKV